MSECRKISEEHLEDFAAKDQATLLRPKNFKRRSSVQKFIHICNQSYQVFPYVFFWVQEFQTGIHKDIWKVKPVLKSVLALRLGVYLSIALLSAELAYCLVATLSLLLLAGSGFFLFCIVILSAMAFQIFDFALEFGKNPRGSFFVKKKKKSN